jgi:hypothetical protein
MELGNGGYAPVARGWLVEGPVELFVGCLVVTASGFYQ